jgi:PD-(D/E)XK endonuclease
MRKLKPREQGDIGELSAMEWLASRGAHIYVPVGHSPDIDLVAELDGVVLRVEVKTATSQISSGRWNVQIATRGGTRVGPELRSTSIGRDATISLSTSAMAGDGLSVGRSR